jgi:GWxTD domain-containing protein
LLSAAALAGSALPLGAQDMAAGDSLLAAGDTSAAIAAYEAVVRRNNRDAEAHYRAGVLYRSRFVPGTRVSAERRAAEAHFRYATRFEPDSAKYWLALAELLRTEEEVTTRAQVAGLVERARQAARKHGSGETARVEYRIALIEWERYEQFGRRYLLASEVLGVNVAQIMDDWRYTEDFFRVRARPDPGNPGEAPFTAAEEALRQALAAEPRLVDAAGLLAVLLGEHDRWPEAYEMARQLTHSAPDSGRAWAVLGLSLVRLGRWREAQQAFDRALERMTPEQRAPYDNLGLILSAADSTTIAAASPGARAAWNSLYWTATQPLFLGQLNETRLEFFARLAYVIHRWSDPLRGYQGYESDRGAVYVRYGPPDVFATFGRWVGSDVGDPVGSLEHERNTIVWVYYASHLRFAFSLNPGFTRAVFGGDHRSFYAESRNAIPVRFDNVPVVRTLDTIAVQVGQFRSDSAGRTTVVIYAEPPVGRMLAGAELGTTPLVQAAIVKDSALRDVVRERRQDATAPRDSLEVGHTSWRLTLPPREYLLRVEAVLAAVERAARSSAALRVRSFAGDTLMMSDVIAAARVTPRDSTVDRWTELLVQPAAGRFRPGEELALFWEVYNLTPDSTGTARYEVEVRFTVQELERRGIAARFLGGIADAAGLSAEGDDQVALAYRRDLIATEGRAVEYLSVDLQGAPEASYLITVTITDLVAHRTTSTDRRIAVSTTVPAR